MKGFILTVILAILCSLVGCSSVEDYTYHRQDDVVSDSTETVGAGQSVTQSITIGRQVSEWRSGDLIVDEEQWALMMLSYSGGKIRLLFCPRVNGIGSTSVNFIFENNSMQIEREVVDFSKSQLITLDYCDYRLMQVQVVIEQSAEWVTDGVVQLVSQYSDSCLSINGECTVAVKQDGVLNVLDADGRVMYVKSVARGDIVYVESYAGAVEFFRKE